MRNALLTLLLLLVGFDVIAEESSFKFEVGDGANAIWLTMKSLEGRRFGLVDEPVPGVVPSGQLAIPYVSALRWPENTTAEQRHLTNHCERTPPVAGKQYFFARFGGRSITQGDGGLGELIYLPTLAIDKRVLEHRDIPALRLGRNRLPGGIHKYFEHYDVLCREMHEVAREHGFLTAIPTGHQANGENGEVFGAFLVRAEACDVLTVNGRAALTDPSDRNQVPLPDANFNGWGSYVSEPKYRLQEWSRLHFSGRIAFLVSTPMGAKFGPAQVAVFKADVARELPVNHSILIVAGGPRFPDAASKAAKEWEETSAGGLEIAPYRAKKVWRDGEPTDDLLKGDERTRLQDKYQLGVEFES